MPFGILSGVPDVITHAKFCVSRLRGFSAATPPKVPFPILFRTTLTTVLHYRADCDIRVKLMMMQSVASYFCGNVFHRVPADNLHRRRKCASLEY